MELGWYERMHMRHRRWCYEYKSEKPSLAFLQSLDLDRRTLIDVGANRGIYTWIMSQCAGPVFWSCNDRVLARARRASISPRVPSTKF